MEGRGDGGGAGEKRTRPPLCETCVCMCMCVCVCVCVRACVYARARAIVSRGENKAHGKVRGKGVREGRGGAAGRCVRGLKIMNTPYHRSVKNILNANICDTAVNTHL